VVSGREQLVGSSGEVLADFTGEGWARVHGENWRVRSSVPLKAGARVKVRAMQRLVLEVYPDQGV
jgi:membrane-bound serine protease (ClpP class)